jgi:hypothetical protein
MVMQQAAGHGGKKLDEGGARAIRGWAEAGAGGPQQGLALLLGAYQGGQSEEVLKALQNVLTSTDRPTQPGAEGALLRKLHRAGGPEQRLGLLRSDPAMLRAALGAQAPGVGAMLRRESQAGAELAGAEGVVAETVAAALRAEPWGRERFLQEQEAAEESARAATAIGPRGALRAYQRKRYAEAEAGRGTMPRVAVPGLEVGMAIGGPYKAAGELMADDAAELAKFRARFYGEGSGANLSQAAVELSEAAKKQARSAPDRTMIPGGEQ